ncbi:SLAP domain-containing protein [Lacticaseibacillus zhaodongensis]|uniref:SLAP domain-containing protein n=1 Tax=Lacticaseibacillus zhaodongensis TaxID=2668065 RepID=UPI0012D2ED79|nr:SLAP domain-containing protein [Lacticaseibacillus zhaodongensis]
MKKQVLRFASAAATALALAPTAVAISGKNPVSAATNTTKTIGNATVTTTATSTKYVASPVSVYASNGSRIVRTLLKGTKLAIKGTALIGGKSFFYLGTNSTTDEDEFVLNTNLSDTPVSPDVVATGIVKVTATDGAQIVNKNGVANGQQLNSGSSWKIFGSATIGGHQYFNVGGDQYVYAGSVIVTSGSPDTSNDPVQTINGTGAGLLKAEPNNSTSATTSGSTASSTTKDSSTAATTTSTTVGPTITPASGKIQIGNAATVVFDQNGDSTNKVLNAGSSWKYFGTAVIGGLTYYNVGGNQFVRQSAATVDGPTALSGQVTVSATRAYVFKSDGATPVLKSNGTIKALGAGSTWKVFAELQLGNRILYDLGGGQYVDASDVAYKSPAEVSAEANTTAKSGIATINYVPGYGIQVWHADSTMVLNSDGSAKKLMNGTQWKIFNQRIVDGHTYYGLGGDQWIDSSYVSFHALN